MKKVNDLIATEFERFKDLGVYNQTQGKIRALNKTISDLKSFIDYHGVSLRPETITDIERVIVDTIANRDNAIEVVKYIEKIIAIGGIN